MSKDLGQKLVEEKVITEKALSDAKDFQKQKGGRLTSALIATGALTEEQLAEFLSKFCGVPAVNLKELAIDSELIKLIPAEVARKHMLMPINRAGSTLILVMADPSHVFAQDDIKFLTGYNVEVAVASERQIKEAIEQYYKNVDEMEFLGDIDDLEMEPEKVEEINLGELEKASEEASVIKMVNGILTDAIKKGASHIHLEPAESALSVRYRIDGILYTISNLSSKMKKAVIARLKIMSGMDIAERRLWQEGNLKIKMTQNGEFSYAVSAMPTAYGEKIVLKVLDKSIYQKPLTKMGLAEKQLEILQKSLRTPGLVIVTGDDSKVTLYGILRKLNKPGVSIATIE